MKILGFFVAATFLTTGIALQAQEILVCPEVECCAYESPTGLSVSVDYLYWKAQEEQLYPVFLEDPSNDSGSDQGFLVVTNQKFEYTSGFRAAVGYTFPCEAYDVKLAWTRFHPRTTGNYEAPVNKGLIAIPFFDLTSSDVPHAASLVSHWHLNYDMLDLDLGRQYAISPCFTLRPHIGLKGGWIDQTQKMQANDIILGQGQPQPIAFAQGTVDRRNNFNGIGPSIGVDMRFALGSQFGLFGTVTGALLYGKFDLTTVVFISDTLDNNTNLPIGPKTLPMKTSGCFVSPTVQILLGGDWATCFCEKYGIRLGVAYEVQYWWNQLKTLNSLPQLFFLNCPTGNLMMHGLTVQASFEF